MTLSRSKHALRHSRVTVKRAVLAAIATAGLAVSALVIAGPLSPGLAATGQDAYVGAPAAADLDAPAPTNLDAQAPLGNNSGQCRAANQSSQATTDVVPYRNTVLYRLHWSNCDNTYTKIYVTYPNNGNPYTQYAACVPPKTDMVVGAYLPTYSGNAPYIDGRYIQPSQSPGC
jgi:hypothetical protein